MGLRERKKARQRTAILEIAVEMCTDGGLDALRVRDLIARLEISEATFFNYFPSKSDLLDAWLEDELANAFAGLGSESRGLRVALRRRVRGLADACATAEGLAANAWARGRVHLAARAASPRTDLAAALAAASDAGELRRDVATEDLAELLIVAVAAALSSARASGRASPAARALCAADLVLDGARRRHERVRLPAPSAVPTTGGRAP